MNDIQRNKNRELLFYLVQLREKIEDLPISNMSDYKLAYRWLSRQIQVLMTEEYKHLFEEKKGES